MQVIKRDMLGIENLPGRQIQKAVGKDGLSSSGRMTMGFAHFSDESGPVEPHHHAEEIVYVLSAQDGWISSGPEQDRLGPPLPLEGGMVLHIPPLEWHGFGFSPGGHIDILFFYGQVDNIRPEEISR